MTRKDTAVIGLLVVLLAVIAGVIGIPALQATAASPEPSPTPSVAGRPYREGVVSHPVSVSPLTAKTQADRDLVALVFSGLVRNGPDGTIVPDLAERWSVDSDGRVWTFELRPDARWHDGAPVTADDVVYTIHTLQDPAYEGPGATSWSEVEVRAVSPTEVTFTLATPLGGFLQAATQPIAPAHLLADVPVSLLPDHPFGQQPVGSGPFALESLDPDKAVLVPAGSVEDESVEEPSDTDASSAVPSGLPTDSLTTAAPTLRPERPTPYLEGIELHFYDDADALAAAYRGGDLDAASGLPPAMAAELARSGGSRLMRYPGSTLTAVLLNLRPDHPEFRDPAVRTALLSAIDRVGLIDEAYASVAAPAPGPIPPSSPLFDPAAEPMVDFSVSEATKALKKAGWTRKADGWYPPGAKAPLTIEVLSTLEATNPAVYAAAEKVVADWRALGLGVTHSALPTAELVGEHLSTGKFSAAVTDVAIGLDPDLYPLLASSQTRTGGSNIEGVQDPALDKLLMAARAPGTPAERYQAYSALQKALGASRLLLPLAYQDEAVVLRDTVEGPVPRQVAAPSDRFWDVLTWRLADGR